MACYWFCLFICPLVLLLVAEIVHPHAEDLDDRYQKFRSFLQCANSTRIGAELGYRYYEDHGVRILLQDEEVKIDACWYIIAPFPLTTVYADDGEGWVMLKDYPDISMHPVYVIPDYNYDRDLDEDDNLTLVLLPHVVIYEGSDGLKTTATNSLESSWTITATNSEADGLETTATSFS